MKDWYKYRYLVLTARSVDYTRFGAVYAAATDAEAAEEEAAALNEEDEEDEMFVVLDLVRGTVTYEGRTVRHAMPEGILEQWRQDWPKRIAVQGPAILVMEKQT
jgi:hypothetical protein